MGDHKRISSAVMNRRDEPADSLDFFPTPPWATRALFEEVLPKILRERSINNPRDWLAARSAFDPCCGEGHMSRVVQQYASFCEGIDVHAYSDEMLTCDFLRPDIVLPMSSLVVMNPPFKSGHEFIKRALTLASSYVCALVRTNFLEGQLRYSSLFLETPPSHVFQFVGRVPMQKNMWVINGSTATSYCWLIFCNCKTHEQQRSDTKFDWIAPCRKSLTFESDAIEFDGWYRRRDVAASAEAGRSVWAYDRARDLAAFGAL